MNKRESIKYPMKHEEYKEKEKAYSKKWQILFFFIAIFAVFTYFLPEVIINYCLKIEVDRLYLQITGVLLVFGVFFLSRYTRRALAVNCGLYCPKCSEVFDYWSDKKNAVSYGGICPNCKFKITDIEIPTVTNDSENDEDKEDK